MKKFALLRFIISLNLVSGQFHFHLRIIWNYFAHSCNLFSFVMKQTLILKSRWKLIDNVGKESTMIIFLFISWQNGCAAFYSLYPVATICYFVFGYEETQTHLGPPPPLGQDDPSLLLLSVPIPPRPPPRLPASVVWKI